MTLSQRSTIKTDMPQEIQTGSRLEILNVPQTLLEEEIIEYETSIPAYSSVTFNIYPPTGCNGRLYQLQLWAELISVGDTSNHRFYLQLGADMIFLLGAAHKDTDLWFNYRHWYMADFESLPPGVEAQALAMESAIFNDVVELQIVYANDTPDSQDSGLILNLITEVTSKWV